MSHCIDIQTLVGDMNPTAVNNKEGVSLIWLRLVSGSLPESAVSAGENLSLSGEAHRYFV